MTIVALTPRGDYAADRVAEWGLRALGTQAFSQQDRAAITLPALSAAARTATTVLYFGHGQLDAWIECFGTGFQQPSIVRRIVDVPSAAALGATVVLAFACLSAGRLGQEAVAQGVRRYIGFTKTLFWYPQSARSEEALRLVVRDLVSVTLRDGEGATRDQFLQPIRTRQQYFNDLAGRGDHEAVSIAGTLAILAHSITLH